MTRPTGSGILPAPRGIRDREGAEVVRPADDQLGRALDLLGYQWVLLMLQRAFFGVRRYNDWKQELGMTQVLVEHNLGVVLDIADRIVVLNFGRVIADGTPDEVAGDPDVQAAYLGSHAQP